MFVRAVDDERGAIRKAWERLEERIARQAQGRRQA